MGGQFKGDEICGAVLSVRYQEACAPAPLSPLPARPPPPLLPAPQDLLSLWNKSADSRRVCMQIRDTLRQVTGLPADATMEYKKHTDSMRDNSSYRNANANF